MWPENYWPDGPVSSLSNYGESYLASYLVSGTTYVALFSSNPDEDASGTELTGNNYSRVSISAWTGTGDTRTNTNAITFPTATGNWTEATHVGLFDAISGGNMLIYGTLTTPVTVASGSAFQFQAGSLSVALD